MGIGKTFTAWAAIGAAALALSGCGGGSSASDYVKQTAYGQVAGASDPVAQVASWKGIPFAQAPVGALRWKAPVDPAAWSGPRAATSFGNACLQNGRIYGPGLNNTYDATIATSLNTPVGSEDCLTLNIWRPDTGEANLPVIFFVYGGSDISGYTADPVYDGTNLARTAKAVVVTANYRVGPLGFFNLAQLKGDGGAVENSGNYALLDILQALKFVKGNIANFGGDPAKVTLMGQSAGAINVWALMTSPMATGLFQRAAPLSGGISLASNLPPGNLPTLNPASVYTAQANNLLYKLLIADNLATDTASAQAWVGAHTAAEVASYMRGKDAKALLTTLLVNGLTGSGPIPDGNLIPVDPIAAIKAGNYNKMPVMASNTNEEGKLFAPFMTLLGGPPAFKITDATRFNLMKDFNPNAPATLTEADILDPFYIPSGTAGTGWTARANQLSSIFFLPSRDNVMNALATQQSDLYYYRFDWAQEPAPWNTVYGAAHAFDLPFVFGNFGPSLFSNAANSTANQPGRLALSSAMMASVGAFARSGDPNNAALGTTWPTWPGKLVFDATLTKAVISTQ